MAILKGAAVALATALTAGACAFAGEDRSSGDARGQEAEHGGPETTPAAAPEKNLGSRDTSAADGSKVRVTLTSLAREGGIATLNFTATVLGGGSGTSWQISDFFDTGDQSGPGQKTDWANGVYLIDGKNRKKHLAATDTNGNCVCSGNLGATFVRGGQTVVLTTTFAAPPENVNAVDVNVPHAGTFRNVPIS
jgi:hypothetical protein